MRCNRHSTGARSIFFILILIYILRKHTKRATDWPNVTAFDSNASHRVCLSKSSRLPSDRNYGGQIRTSVASFVRYNHWKKHCHLTTLGSLEFDVNSHLHANMH